MGLRAWLYGMDPLFRLIDVNRRQRSLLQGRYRSDSDLRDLFEAVGAFERDRAICYCRGGISATMDALALTRLGHPSVAVYDGSMSEWAADPGAPVETGVS